VNDFKTKIIGRTGLTNFDRTSKVRALSQSLIDELIFLREEHIAAARANQLSTSRGTYLDELGAKCGLRRFTMRHASASQAELNVAFYVESGTFGDINSANPISIPVGALVLTDPNSNELNSAISFRVTPTTLAANESIAYVSVQAEVAGTGSNIGASVIRRHNVTGYTDVANNSLKVVNFYPILNGINDETDDSYRSRIYNHYNTLITSNELRLRLRSLEVPGILDTNVVPGYYGIGSTAVFALGPENQTNPMVLRTLQSRLNDWKPPGGNLMATAATEVLFDFNLKITSAGALTAAQIARIKTDINRILLGYFGGTNLGGQVSLKAIATLFQKKLSGIVSLQQIGGEDIFGSVYLRKRFASGISEEQIRLLGDTYSLDVHEFASLGVLDIQVM
jgi:uncharacterized phage protein gp47/JayE